MILLHPSVLALISGLILTVTAFDGFEDQYGTVEYVNILFRHGARNPDSLAPRDPYKDKKNWPEGLGQLTKEGILQHFTLGTWLSQRYRHLLPAERGQVNEALNVVSTDWDRTLMSADAEMSGMFPIFKGAASSWNGLTSFPIPVHSMPPALDELLEVTVSCPRYAALVQNFMNSEEYEKILAKYQSMTDHLSRYSGNRFRNLDFYMEMFTTYAIEEARGFKLPDWVKSVYPNPMIEPTILSFEVPTWTTPMKRLRGGPFIKQIIENFWGKSNRNLDPPSLNISMYSAHDTTISAVLNSMGIFNRLPPPFASMVLFEMRKTREGDRNVMIWYKNSTYTDPISLKLPNCNIACPLSQFERELKPVIPENWVEECKRVPEVSITNRVGLPIKPVDVDYFGKRKNKIYFKTVGKEDGEQTR